MNQEQLIWRIDHCDYSLTALRSLLNAGYGLSELGKFEIYRLIRFWVKEKSYKVSELRNNFPQVTEDLLQGDYF